MSQGRNNIGYFASCWCFSSLAESISRELVLDFTGTRQVAGLIQLIQDNGLVDR